MDSAYAASAIREHSLQLGHRPITDHPKRYRKSGERKVPLRKNSRSWTRVIDCELRAEEMTWAERDRFAERTMVERVFSRLKDKFGARAIRLRGASKIMAHLIVRPAGPHRRSTAQTDRLDPARHNTVHLKNISAVFCF